MSKSRVPAFSNPLSAACSRNTAAGPSQAKAAAKPIRRATWANIHQSGRASPGASRNLRWREMRRSELVTVPSFSPQPAAGSTTCPKRVVSVGQQSDTATNGHAASAARTRPVRGRLAAGLVATIHSAFTRPSSTASNRSTALRPGRRRASARSRTAAACRGGPDRRSPDARRVGWPARRPRARPSRSAGR